MSLDGLRESRQRPPHGWAGTILDDATTLQDEVRVLLDAFRDSRRPHGPMPFLPGSVLPNEGDRCLVMFDEARRGRIVWWGTEDSLPGGGGGSSPPWAISDTTGLQAALNAKQALHANLTAFSGLTGAADRLAYFTGAGTMAVTPITAAARALLDDADAAAMRTTLGLLSMAVQAASAVAITGGTITGIADLDVGDGGTGASTAAGARTNLGAQAQDTDLDSIAALTSAANKVPYATGAGTWAMADLSPAARNLLDDLDAAAMRTTLGLVIGTDVQAQDAQLAAIAGLTPAADQIIYWTGATAAAMTALTPTARTLLDDTSIGAMRTTLDVPSNAEAILDTLGDAKGDLIGFSADNTPVRVAIGADGTRPEADSTQTAGFKWSTPAGKLSTASFLDIVNLATEQTLFTYSVPGNLLPGRALHLILDGDYLNNSAATRTLTVRVKYGATTLFDDVTAAIAASATRRAFRLELDLFGDGSGQGLSGRCALAAVHAVTAGRGDFATASFMDAVMGGTASEDATATKTFSVTVQHSTNHASLSIRRQTAILSLV